MSKKRFELLNDAQWELIEPLLPEPKRLKKRGIDLIVPYRENNKKKKHEDGRKLRRYKRRWIIEPTDA
jgi:hypothetical protein